MLLRPSSVSIHDDGDMPREFLKIDIVHPETGFFIVCMPNGILIFTPTTINLKLQQAIKKTGSLQGSPSFVTRMFPDLRSA
jgi:hypothetical protein